jgi:hypothetical protein
MANPVPAAATYRPASTVALSAATSSTWARPSTSRRARRAQRRVEHRERRRRGGRPLPRPRLAGSAALDLERGALLRRDRRAREGLRRHRSPGPSSASCTNPTARRSPTSSSMPTGARSIASRWSRASRCARASTSCWTTRSSRWRARPSARPSTSSTSCRACRSTPTPTTGRTYKDRYRRRLRRLVKDKEAGETIKAPPAPKAPGPPPDIMEALKASLDKVRAG